MGYKEHGLTREEDGLSGAFGTSTDIDREELELNSYPSNYRYTFASLVKKGLLQRHFDESENVTYLLTPVGKRLYNIRAKEEETGPNG